MVEPKTNTEWIEWGRRDPFFGVSSWAGKSSDGADPWTPEAFYDLGTSDWRDFARRWRHYGLTTGSFVEIGCGAGRITRQLAEAFERGDAVDVSAGMISRAKAHVSAENVAWHVTNGLSIPLPSNAVDAAFSCHVFQHLPSADAGLAYFQEIARVLKPGGSLMIHLPLFNFPFHPGRAMSVVCDVLYRNVVLPVREARLALARYLMKRGGIPPMAYTRFDQNQLYAALHGMNLTRVEFLTFPLTSNGDPHSFVMATKVQD